MAKRKNSLDFLRVLAILGIIMFHHFGNRTPNHFIELAEGFTNETYFYDFINNIPGRVSVISLVMDFCYGHFGNGGNLIFMLITGYFLFDRKISFSKRTQTVGKILYAIVFYGIVLTIWNIIVLRFFIPFDCYPEYHPIFLLPNWISGENMWYLQAYGIFILAIVPVLKLFENKMTQKRHICLAASLLFIHFLDYQKYLPNIVVSLRILNFIMCYYVGGYFAKYPIHISRKKLAVSFGLYTIFYFLYEYYWRYANAVSYTPSQYSFISVVQPFLCCVIYSVLLFLIFVKTDLPPCRFSTLLSKLSSSTIGIYIFHYNMISISFIMANTFWWNNWSRKGYFFFAVIDSLLLLVIGYFIDRIRIHSYAHFETHIKSLFPSVQEGLNTES